MASSMWPAPDMLASYLNRSHQLYINESQNVVVLTTRAEEPAPARAVCSSMTVGTLPTRQERSQTRHARRFSLASSSLLLLRRSRRAGCRQRPGAVVGIPVSALVPHADALRRQTRTNAGSTTTGPRCRVEHHQYIELLLEAFSLSSKSAMCSLTTRGACTHIQKCH